MRAEWHAWRTFSLTLRCDWGDVWAEAARADDEAEWRACVRAVARSGRILGTREGLRFDGGQAVVKAQMLDAAKRMALDIAQKGTS